MLDEIRWKAKLYPVQKWMKCVSFSSCWNTRCIKPLATESFDLKSFLCDSGNLTNPKLQHHRRSVPAKVSLLFVSSVLIFFLCYVCLLFTSAVYSMRIDNIFKQISYRELIGNHASHIRKAYTIRINHTSDCKQHVAIRTLPVWLLLNCCFCLLRLVVL